MKCKCGKILTEQEVQAEDSLAKCIEHEYGDWDYRCQPCRRAEFKRQYEDDMMSYSACGG